MTDHPLKMISVRQPWASAIASGAKLVENRSTGFPKSYRGLLAIHASKTWSHRGARDPRIRELWPEGTYVDLPRGAVVAVAELVDAHPAAACCAPWGEETYVDASGELRREVTHLVLEDVQRLVNPIPARGALGLWTPDEDLALELERALCFPIEARS